MGFGLLFGAGLWFGTFGLFGLLLVGCGFSWHLWLWFVGVGLVLGVDIVWRLSVFCCLTVGGVVWDAVLSVGFAWVV